MLHPLRPTPHGVGSIPTPLSLTPLYLTPIAVPRLRFGRPHRLPSWMRVRTRLLLAASLPLLLALAALAIERAEVRAREERARRAMGEAEMFAASVTRPLRESGHAPNGDGLDALVARVERLASITSTHDTEIVARVVTPNVVEIVTRSRVADGSGTAVCMAALRWVAEALPPDAFGPRCALQSSA